MRRMFSENQIKEMIENSIAQGKIPQHINDFDQATNEVIEKAQVGDFIYDESNNEYYIVIYKGESAFTYYSFNQMRFYVYTKQESGWEYEEDYSIKAPKLYKHILNLGSGNSIELISPISYKPSNGDQLEELIISALKIEYVVGDTHSSILYYENSSSSIKIVRVDDTGTPESPLTFDITDILDDNIDEIEN